MASKEEELIERLMRENGEFLKSFGLRFEKRLFLPFERALMLATSGTSSRMAQEPGTRIRFPHS
jgi:hypothetical protein